MKPQKNRKEIGKKGIGTLVEFILVIVTITVLFGAVPLYSQIVSKAGDVEGCRWSFIITDVAKEPFTGKSPFRISCERKTVEITKNDAYNRRIYEPEKLENRLAQELRECWYKTGEGKKSPFERDYFAGERHCVICSQVSFDAKLISSLKKDNQPIVISGVYTYLNTTTMGRGYGNPENTYVQYFNDKTYAGSYTDWDKYNPGKPEFNSNDIPLRDLAIIYGYYKRPTTNVFRDHLATLLVVPQANFNDLGCTIIWN